MAARSAAEAGGWEAWAAWRPLGRSLPIRSSSGIGRATLAASAVLLVIAGAAVAADGGGRVAVPVPSPEAIRFHRTGLALWFLGRAWSIGVPTLIVLSGLSARIRRLAMGRSRPWLVGVAAYGVILLGVEFLVNLPLRYYAGFVRLREYGLSTQPFDRWLGEALKHLGVELAGVVLLLWVPYWLMARSPRRWWLYTGLLTLPLSWSMALIAPVWIDPLFNDFGPMKDKALEAKIAGLARRAGIDDGKIFEVDKSRDTTTVNAYVTGLFGTKRIVLWDTTLAKLEDDEILVVMGHEIGHFVLNHVMLGLTLSSLATIGGLYVVHRSAGRLIRRHAGRFGFDRIGDVASAPLLLALVQGMVLLVAPASNALSRWMEHEADRFALEITRDNHAGASGFAKMQVDNLSIPRPDPFSRLWRSSHPAIGDRIEFFNDYRPWESGGPLRYGDRFRDH